MTHKRGDRIF